jgi:pimeloyl-ACP methyl ester carboxylesterase
VIAASLPSRGLGVAAGAFRAATLAALALSLACEPSASPPFPQSQEVKPREAAPLLPRPVEVVSVDVASDVPAFVLHGAKGAEEVMVFLHGRCAHALGYVQAFQFAAVERGTVIAPQGDEACGSSPFRRWSPDIDKLNARIEAALKAAGYEEPSVVRDRVAIGYSEGASRAEALAHRFPERYSRVILIGAPAAPSAVRLRAVRGAVMMAGDRDAQEPMKAGMRSLLAASIPATFIAIPGAAHGGMGDGERVMRAAFDWLWANAKPAM